MLSTKLKLLIAEVSLLITERQGSLLAASQWYDTSYESSKAREGAAYATQAVYRRNR